MASMEYTSNNTWIKTCPRCEITFSVEANKWDEAYSLMHKYFARVYTNRSLDDFNGYCRECSSASSQRRDRANRKALLEAQAYQCKLCNKPITHGHMDHSHLTGKIRSVLCHGCNIKMAAVDNDEWLAKAIAYRDKYREDN